MDKDSTSQPDSNLEDQNSQIKASSITQTMEDNFLRYSMSVIIARALPDVRDGLKPVHRRILYSMNKNGIKSGSKTVKSARIIGDVMGKYHPHGNLAIYDAMARLAVDWSTRYILIIGQGNFGTMDGDPPAADRYTEAKLSKHAEVLLDDLDKETVNFRPNYDGTEVEPEVLPAKLPNLLLNGQIGIAVGMATSIPPHNLSEVIDATVALIDEPESKIEDALKFIKGPDFPTGGLVYAGEDMYKAYATGRGSVIIRAKAEIEEKDRKTSRIIITEMPYAINMSNMIERIADLVRNKKITAISDIRDESARGKIRIVIDLKKDAYPKKILNQLYKYTSLQTAFHFNMLALIDGIQPRVLGLLDILKEHIKHRQTVVRRRTEYELHKAQNRAHILEGLNLALDHIDAIIKLIRAAETSDEAKAQLIKKFKLTDIQASAILAMQLRSLAGLERQKIIDELADLRKLITKLEKLLASDKLILKVVREELLELKDKFQDQRRSQIIPHDLDKFSDEDLIPNEEVIVTLTIINYIKRTQASDYKQQRRGGKGRRGIVTRDEDLVQDLIQANTHDTLLFFTNTGRVFSLRCHEIPVAKIDAKGVNIANLLALRSDETISAMFKIDKGSFKAEDIKGNLFMCTKKGVVKKTALSQYQNLRQNGLITINLQAGDELKYVRLSSGDHEVIISTAQGQSNRFSEKDVRTMGRTARGVRGIRLRQDDYVVGMDLVEPDMTLLFLSQNGYGKRTKIEEFTTHRRGGYGVKSLVINEKIGNLVFVHSLTSSKSEIVAISEKGKTIRVATKNIRCLRRATQGVRLMKVDADDQVVSAIVLANEEEESRTELTKPKSKKSQASKQKS
ncbi:MAG: DNA gyrase subunit A [Candidatus Saccharibacteria bacterium]|nr:DNA gyrase subunit A [Candidatus Saccharibacteria bacterium]